MMSNPFPETTRVAAEYQKLVLYGQTLGLTEKETKEVITDWTQSQGYSLESATTRWAVQQAALKKRTDGRPEMCWLTHCKVNGHQLIAGGYRIMLCLKHKAELESTAQGGYSTADPPRHGGRRVPADFVKANGGPSTWWPWERIE